MIGGMNTIKRESEHLTLLSGKERPHWNQIDALLASMTSVATLSSIRMRGPEINAAIQNDVDIIRKREAEQLKDGARCMG
jgi:hypothetical protein